MKKSLMLFVLFALFVQLAATETSAAQPIIVKVDGVKKQFVNQPVYQNKSLYVPVGELYAMFNYDKAYDSDRKTLHLGRVNRDCITLKAGSKTATIGTDDHGSACLDSKNVTLKVALKQANEDFLVPLEFISNYIDAKITWDEKNKTLNLQSIPYVYPGFNLYKADGFGVNVSRDWKSVYSTVNDDGTETHHFIYQNDIAYTAELSILPYENTQVPKAFVTEHSYFRDEEIYPLDKRNAETAYLGIQFVNEDAIDGFTKTLFTFKGNLCYMLTFQFSKPIFVNDYAKEKYTKDVSKFTEDSETMLLSFYLTSQILSLDGIIATTTKAQDYLDQVNNIQRDGTKAIDKYGKQLSNNDIVTYANFYGVIKKTNGSQILVNWNKKSIFVPDGDEEFWASVAGIKYKATSWIDSVKVMNSN